MALDSLNRETVRDKVYDLLVAKFGGAGGICQAVYGYRIKDYANYSPIIFVTSVGTARKQKMIGAGAPWRTHVLLAVVATVAYADSGTWGPDDAEDALDLIDKKMADMVGDNRTATGYWDSLAFYNEDFSVIDWPVIGGIQYKREVWFLIAEMHGK